MSNQTLNQAIKDALNTQNQDPSEQVAQMPADMHAFFERADQFITLANSLLSPNSHSGQVAASLTYAAARFATSAASVGFVKGSDFAKEKADIIEFCTQQYQKMLSDNIDDYAENFEKYTGIKG
ncbi:MAG: DUF3144 domain-containing protein [Moraxella sp.]|jgi:hypothetical protein|nr:MAG: DUF3144 domain-containing protein [Moraxella sp.]